MKGDKKQMTSIINVLKKDLIKTAQNKPLTSIEVIKTSQKLDKHIVSIMKKQYKNKKKT